jgi:hypothetical protein
LQLITVDVTEKTNVLGFRDNNLSYNIQQYISNDQAYDNLLDKKIDKKQAFVRFPCSNTAGTLLVVI